MSFDGAATGVAMHKSGQHTVSEKAEALELYQERCRELESLLEKAQEARREGSQYALSWRSRYYQLRDEFSSLSCRMNFEVEPALERVSQLEAKLAEKEAKLEDLRIQNRELNRTADKLGFLCNQLKDDVVRVSSDKSFYSEKVQLLLDELRDTRYSRMS